MFNCFNHFVYPERTAALSRLIFNIYKVLNTTFIRNEWIARSQRAKEQKWNKTLILNIEMKRSYVHNTNVSDMKLQLSRHFDCMYQTDYNDFYPMMKSYSFFICDGCVRACMYFMGSTIIFGENWGRKIWKKL